MAIVATVTLIDSLNTETTKRYETETSVLATAQANMVTMIAALEAITELGVVSINYAEKDDSEASAAAADSSVDPGATFRVRLDDGFVAAHKVPGFPISKVSSGRNIDVTDVDVVAYFDLFAPAGPFTLNRGNTVSAVLSGTYDV